MTQPERASMAKVAFTVGRVSKFKCPPTKKQDFMWDSGSPGLGLRSTPNGKSAYVFQGVFNRKDLRITIGNTSAWSIKDAQEKSREIQRMIDEGRDPRQVKRESESAAASQRQEARIRATTVQEAWSKYLEERRPHWGETHYNNHLEKASPGGIPSKRRGMTNRLTKPGPLAALMPLALKDLDTLTIEAWAAKEGKIRPSSARLAWRQLSVFLNWCSEHHEYAIAIPSRNPAKSRKIRESLGKTGTRDDALLREQLPAWFAAIRQLPNQTISAALQVMLLTGARPGEV
jgi:Arm DNA-binding domain